MKERVDLQLLATVVKETMKGQLHRTNQWPE